MLVVMWLVPRKNFTRSPLSLRRHKSEQEILKNLWRKDRIHASEAACPLALTFATSCALPAESQGASPGSGLAWLVRGGLQK